LFRPALIDRLAVLRQTNSGNTAFYHAIALKLNDATPYLIGQWREAVASPHPASVGWTLTKCDLIAVSDLSREPIVETGPDTPRLESVIR
jgi:hypothetical protein